MPINKQLANTQDLVAIEEIRDNTVLLKNGSLRQVLMVGGINTALKAEDELDTIAGSYQNFLNSLDFPIQIIVHSRKINIEKYLAALEERRRLEPSALLQSQIAEYREFIAGFVRDNDIMEKTFLVVVPFSPTGLPNKETISGMADFIPFFGKKKENPAAAEKSRSEREVSLGESLSQLSQRVNQVVEGLRMIELEAIILNNEELVELFYNFYNPETIEREKINLEKESDKESDEGKEAADLKK